MPLKRSSKKGSASKTHKGDKDYTTKRGDKDFHRKGHNVKKKRKPYTGTKPPCKTKRAKGCKVKRKKGCS